MTHKNIKIYQHGRDFQNHEGIHLPSSQQVYLEKLRSFEGMKISHVRIEDKIINRLDPNKREVFGKYLALHIPIQRRIEAKKFDENYSEPEINSDTEYMFNLVVAWKLYDKGTLVYDNEHFSDYKNPKIYAKRFIEATLLTADIDKKWTTLTLTFDNDLKIIAFNKIPRRNINYFFSIVKQAEPFIQHLDFAKPETIYYANESVQLKIAKRKNRPPFVI